MNWTEAELKRRGLPLPKGGDALEGVETSRQVTSGASTAPPKNKYGARKCEVDGIKFDSEREAEHYKVLKLLADRGVILNLKLQPRFELQPAFERNGRSLRAITYTPDFEYWERGVHHVVEVKGFKTRDYLIRKRLFLYQYQDIQFTEIK